MWQILGDGVLGVVSMRHWLRIAAIGIAALAMVGPASASTVNIIDGDTRIRVTSLPALETVFDVVGAIGGSTTVTGSGTTRFTFDITGGTGHPSGAIIEHAGSGVVLGIGSTFATVNNFIVDTIVGEVRAQVNGTGGFAPIFDAVARPNGAFDLNVSNTLATTLAAAFSNDGLLALEGARFGVARVTNLEVAPVPLPAAGWLLLAGVGGLALMRRRRAQAA